MQNFSNLARLRNISKQIKQQGTFCSDYCPRIFYPRQRVVMSALTKAKQCTPRISMPLFLVTCVGAVLEFYDFAIVLMLANNLAKVFLPEQTTQPFL